MMHPDTQQLEPLTPRTALRMYLDHRDGELASSTMRAHRIRLSHFLRWCDEEDITNMNDLDGRALHRYRLWRKDDGDLKPVSLKTQLHTLCVFLQFCADVNAVHPFLAEAVDLPMLDYEEKVSSAILDEEQAVGILEKLDRYHYASRKHVIFALLWKTGMRQGTLRALDVGDVDINGQHLTITHRPEQGTALKNRQRGERLVALDKPLTNILHDWMQDRRPDVTDKYGREALVSTEQSGRVSRSAIRRTAYTLTRPAFLGESCNCPDTDEHTYNEVGTCVDSVSPHAIRRGAITAHLRGDVPKPVVSDRCDVSIDILDRHYNKLTEAEKLKQRREYLPE